MNLKSYWNVLGYIYTENYSECDDERNVLLMENRRSTFTNELAAVIYHEFSLNSSRGASWRSFSVICSRRKVTVRPTCLLNGNIS
jgi:hypothetical protein